mgnify:CR=1 FL=1
MRLEHCLLGYIDPVSGTLIVQVIIAAVVGTIGFFRKSIWNCVAWIFGRQTTQAEDQRPPEVPGEEITK